MIKPDIPFEKWTRLNGYPKGSRNDGVLSITDKFICDEPNFDITQLTELEQLSFEGLIIQSSNFEVNENSARIIVSIIYSIVSSDFLSTAITGISEFTMDDSGQEIPIDTKKQDGSLWFSNYKTNWNYVLSAKNGTTAVPEFWASETDTALTLGESSSYRWVKDSSDVADDWYVLKDKTKKIESVPIPSPVVTETTKYSTYNQAVAKKITIGSKATPDKTFGETGEWLVTSSSVFSDGKKWVCQTKYQNAPEWDSDIYGS